LFITAYARDRSSLGYGWRKIERQTGLRRMVLSIRSKTVMAPALACGGVSAQA
jgi:hypothetical protein